MIDLHTHSLLSDGALLPSELVQRALKKGYKAIALTDHVDAANISNIVRSTVELCAELNRLLPIKVIPGIELTYVPLSQISAMVDYARRQEVKLVIVHGETIVEPVPEKTNLIAVESGIDILAHPGLIKEEVAELARDKSVFLEISSRRGHCLTNGYIVERARRYNVKLVLNTDTHSPEDLLTIEQREEVARGAGLHPDEIEALSKNSEEIIERC